MGVVRIIAFQCSPRYRHNCPGESSKSSLILERALTLLPRVSSHLDVEVDVVDLAVRGDIVQPCKGCVSTAGGYHCHYPCSCFSRGEYGFANTQITSPDLLVNQDVFKRVERAQGMVFFSPVHWYGLPAQVDAMFSRFVSASMTLTREQAREFGLGKDPVKTRAAAETGALDHLLKNHWEGKVAGFFVHGDGGADDYEGGKSGRKPRSLRMYPDSQSPLATPRGAVERYVLSLRYLGIHVEEDFIVAFNAGEGLPYHENNEMFRELDDDADVYLAAATLLAAIAERAASEN